MKKIIAGLMIAAAVMFGAGSMTAHAATKKNGIAQMAYHADDSYSADVTGDGNKDKIVQTRVDDNTVNLKVNDSLIKTWNPSTTGVAVAIVSVKSKSFIEITVENYSTMKTTCGLYQVNSDKLKSVADYTALLNKKLLVKSGFVTNGGAFDMIFSTKVSGNAVFLDASLATKSLGQIKIQNLKLNYKNNKFSLAKTAGKAGFRLFNMKTGKRKTSFVAKKSLTVYKTAGGKKKAKFKVARKGSFKITNGAIIKKNIYIKIKTSKGKTGWIKLDTKQMVKEKGMLIWG